MSNHTGAIFTQDASALKLVAELFEESPMKQALWPEWVTFKCPFCDESHQVRLASDSLNGPFDEDGNQSPDLVAFAFCPRGKMDAPLVVALGADRRVLKESATVPFSFQDTGSHWSEVIIGDSPTVRTKPGRE